MKCNNGYSVTGKTQNETRLETIGFGMLLSAYFVDKNTFDGIYNFINRSVLPMPIKCWLGMLLVLELTILGALPTAIFCVAFALIIAHIQWGGNYQKNTKITKKT